MSTVTLTHAQANAIADALLVGCLFAASVEDLAQSQSPAEVSAHNTCNRLRDALLLLEGRIAQPEPETA